MFNFKRFFSGKESFFDFFEQHINLTLSSAEEFILLLSPGVERPAIVCKIKMLENEADRITHRCIEELHRAFITPIQREDIFLLINAMDDIIDYIDSVSEGVLLYQIEAVTSFARDQAKILHQSIQMLSEAVKGLRNMRNAKFIHEKCAATILLEKKGDEIFHQAIGNLFTEESDAKAIIKWKSLYERIESAIDACQKVASIIEGILLEHA